MDFRLESPRVPRMYRTLVPVDFRPTVLVSTNSDFRYGLSFSAVAKRALEKSLAFNVVGSTYSTSRFNWSSVKNARLIPASVMPNWAAFIATVKAALLL